MVAAREGIDGIEDGESDKPGDLKRCNREE